MPSTQASTGALSITADSAVPFGNNISTQGKKIGFSAVNSNSIYTDNGLILPQSISKQSFIIYK